MKFLKNVDWELEECKAFLKSSPLKDCKIPLDINGGITGAHIISSSSHRLLKNANLYSLKPFFYMSGQPQKHGVHCHHILAIVLLLSAVMVVSTSAGGGYGVAPATKPAAEIPYYKMTKQNEISKPIAIQGLIY
ncbi:hypothetical protein Ccrd_026542 [Cynara cardunculus var. scolymus]|uniref:Uncharacterized protein n=1 Tax=Cynara cardunculus var. scolymus TaxID=59895 RepID=A0A103NTA9_CYNCS|nr:hypothetical protein Ccrd_026542 [Cynara cardunculus var. scolymus]